MRIALAGAAGLACAPPLRLWASRYADRVARTRTVAAVTGAVCAALAARAGSVPLLVTLGWVAAFGVALAAVDVAAHRLPDPLTGAALAGAVAGFTATAAAVGEYGALWRALLAGLALFGGYLTLAVISPSGLGFGDCKLAAVLGTALGWYGWDTVVAGTAVAFVLAAGCGLALLAARRLGPADPIPFGPFMLLGALAAVLTA